MPVAATEPVRSAGASGAGPAAAAVPVVPASTVSRAVSAAAVATSVRIGDPLYRDAEKP